MKRSFARFLALAPFLVAVAHCAAGSNNTGDARNDVSNGDVVVDTTDAPADDADATLPMDAGDSGPGDAADTSDAHADTARPDVCVPSTEVCNGIDDNCDGTIDESGCPGHLLLSEVVLTPNAAEFVEIYNPTDAAIDLGDVYITDTAIYPHIIESTTAMPIDASDFVARFPDAATIPAHGYQTLATGSPSAWSLEFGGACPTYYLQSTGTIGSCSTSRVMRPVPVTPGSIGATATLTNTGEPIMLFTWDGTSDLVRDIDYVYPGAPTMSGGMVFNEAVDKSMLFIDGPDSDTVASGYLLDTPAAMQSFAPVPGLGTAAIRCHVSDENGETLNGGNGIFGHNETSEHLATTWTTTMAVAGDGGTTIAASPNAANPCP